MVLCVASVQADVDIAQLHRIFSNDIDAARSSVSGQGLTAFDRAASAAARQQNVIYVVPRDVDGAIVEWVTATDISLALLPGVVTSGLFLSYEVGAADSAEGWRVVYTVGGVSTAGSVITLQLDVHGVQLWQGNVRVRAVVLLYCLRTIQQRPYGGAVAACAG